MDGQKTTSEVVFLGTALALSWSVRLLHARQDTGKLGEDIATTQLSHQGYAILARRYRTRFGEIDIVAQDGATLVFVEVKARRSDRFGAAAECVTPWKQRRLAAMALDYMAWVNRLDDRCRFDVIAIDGIGSDGVSVRHIKDAFLAE